jgi:uncharacterized protein YndB with AHSA1/START domain
MQTVHVEHDFQVPPARAFAFLAEHEHLGVLFPAKVTRVRDGQDGQRNGVGSVRRLRIAILPPFEETTTKVVPDELIEYRITKGSPLRGHHGRMAFAPNGSGGTRFVYDITFGAVLPGVDVVVAKALDRSIRAGLPKVDALA